MDWLLEPSCLISSFTEFESYKNNSDSIRLSDLGLIAGKENNVLEKNFSIKRNVRTREKDVSPVLIQGFYPQ